MYKKGRNELWYVDYYVDSLTTYLGTIGMTSGGRLNKKDGLTRYGDSHVKDKTS